MKTHLEVHLAHDIGLVDRDNRRPVHHLGDAVRHLRLPELLREQRDLPVRVDLLGAHRADQELPGEGRNALVQVEPTSSVLSAQRNSHPRSQRDVEKKSKTSTSIEI